MTELRRVGRNGVAQAHCDAFDFVDALLDRERVAPIVDAVEALAVRFLAIDFSPDDVRWACPSRVWCSFAMEAPRLRRVRYDVEHATAQTHTQSAGRVVDVGPIRRCGAAGCMESGHSWASAQVCERLGDEHVTFACRPAHTSCARCAMRVDVSSANAAESSIMSVIDTQHASESDPLVPVRPRRRPPANPPPPAEAPEPDDPSEPEIAVPKVKPLRRREIEPAESERMWL